MTAALPPCGSVERCPGCGAYSSQLPGNAIKWCNRPHPDDNPDPETFAPAHIHVECRRCGFRWLEAPWSNITAATAAEGK